MNICNTFSLLINKKNKKYCVHQFKVGLPKHAEIKIRNIKQGMMSQKNKTNNLNMI